VFAHCVFPSLDDTVSLRPHGEHTAKLVKCFPMARRPDPREEEMLTKENLEELRHNLAHLSLSSVRELYQRAHEDCRLIDRLSSPKKIQTLVAIWKQLWKWR
jgi:hypothetical protein